MLRNGKQVQVIHIEDTVKPFKVLFDGIFEEGLKFKRTLKKNLKNIYIISKI